jgi:tRNA (cytidine/uridine-2'-O-)-methyltransferase
VKRAVLFALVFLQEWKEKDEDSSNNRGNNNNILLCIPVKLFNIPAMKQNYAIALYQTDIAQNFGAICRTCTGFGVPLHVIEPTGFTWNDPKMHRAGMDYLERVDLTRHKSWKKFCADKPKGRVVLITTDGDISLTELQSQQDDIYLFGRESAGVPAEVHDYADVRVRIPMVEGERSFNLAASAAMVIFEAYRQKTSQ